MNRARGISKKRHSVPEGQLINDVTRAVGAPMKHNMHRSQVAAPVASLAFTAHMGSVEEESSSGMAGAGDAMGTSM